ncbi:MAG: transglycosylase domain-containing protein [Sphingorhabdus sp.]
MEEAENTNVSYRLTREMTGAWAWLQRKWAVRWFRWCIYALGLLLLFSLLFWAFFIRNLPDAKRLLEYESPLPTVVRDINGEPFHSYARERRVQLEYADFPVQLVRAYLAAEDKTFFEHGGLDYPGLVRAAFEGLISGGTPRGTSTITQQVAKNLLLTNEVTYTRKMKEAILAMRIEGTLNKQQILSLYLNEIPLGRRSFGVEAASQAYFKKSVEKLDLHEMAFLAILPKAPEKYGRAKNRESAVTRRDWVLREMNKNGWINAEQLASATAQPLGLSPISGPQFQRQAGYFTEAVRRQLMERFGENADDGPYSVYSGGLWVRTSLHPEFQEYATQALRDGLLRYHAGKGWHGPINHVKSSDGDIYGQFLASNIEIDYSNWRAAVLTARRQVKLRDGSEGRLNGGPSSLKVGDIIAVAPAGKNSYNVRTIPEVGGGMAVQNPLNGRVLAVQGGFDSRLSSFNRATQALRQPGSTIKPFVYATALDQGMTPASIILDAPFCVWQSAALGRKCFRNFGGAGGAGPRTMRWGLEQSRNLMTVRAANDAGMENVANTFRAMNIGDYPPYLAFALGAGDTTVLKMTNAYSMLVNHGKKLNPTFIDFVQNRRGKVILPAKWKPCKGCNMEDWDGKIMPRFAAAGKQIMDPVTAYQVVHMLEGVVQRGTATLLKDLGRPMFGKTGTTTGPTNVWFVGGAPNLVAGVYLGYDTPRNMGGYAQGGSTAAPIFKQFAKQALPSLPARRFVAPDGARLVRVDRQSGKRVYGGWPGPSLEGTIIWEAFAAETEPKRSIRREEIAARAKPKRARTTTRAASRPSQSRNRPSTPKRVEGASGTKRDTEFLQQEGGIY